MQGSSRILRTNCRAFSLLELLASITIIAILISLGFVALNASRERAMNIKCLSNMKQIQQGLTLYSGNEGLLPFATFIPFQPDGPARGFQDMMNGWCDAMGVPRPKRTSQKTAKGWWVFDVASVFQCPLDKPFVVPLAEVNELAYSPEYAFAQQVFMSSDYLPGAAMSKLSVRGQDPGTIRRIITQVWEQTPWTPVVDELWQWHNYKSKTAYGNATYMDGSARQSNRGTAEQQKRYEELIEKAVPTK